MADLYTKATWNTGSLNIRLCKGPGGAWILICYELQIHYLKLSIPVTTKLKAAKEAALDFVRDRLKEMLQSIPQI